MRAPAVSRRAGVAAWVAAALDRSVGAPTPELAVLAAAAPATGRAWTAGRRGVPGCPTSVGVADSGARRIPSGRTGPRPATAAPTGSPGPFASWRPTTPVLRPKIACPETPLRFTAAGNRRRRAAPAPVSVPVTAPVTGLPGSAADLPATAERGPDPDPPVSEALVETSAPNVRRGPSGAAAIGKLDRAGTGAGPPPPSSCAGPEACRPASAAGCAADPAAPGTPEPRPSAAEVAVLPAVAADAVAALPAPVRAAVPAAVRGAAPVWTTPPGPPLRPVPPGPRPWLGDAAAAVSLRDVAASGRATGTPRTAAVRAAPAETDTGTRSARRSGGTAADSSGPPRGASGEPAVPPSARKRSGGDGRPAGPAVRPPTAGAVARADCWVAGDRTLPPVRRRARTPGCAVPGVAGVAAGGRVVPRARRRTGTPGGLLLAGRSEGRSGREGVGER